jgi:S-DNA-T family DNA segregation ATPase FtsK/SpoIIIE
MVGSSTEEDELFDQAVRVVLKSKRGAASMLQRAFFIGYNRASRLIEMMTEQGILGPHRGSKQRELLITLEEWEERYGAELGLESDAYANKEANNEA